MRVFVTGGSGFVGGAVLRAFRHSHETRAMARSEAAAEIVTSLGASPVRCSLQDVTAAHLEGAEAVVHCAAYVEEWGPEHAYRTANVEGTANLLRAARAAGVRRFLHLSTESVLFRGDHLRDVDEETPYPELTPFDYSASKSEAERMVVAGNHPEQGFETVVVRPVLIWGPGDRKVLPELIAMVEAGKFVWFDHGRHEVSPTHIENLVHGIDLALHRGQPGEIYFITDHERFPLRDFLGRYVATAGIMLPSRSIPGWLARGAARLIEGAWDVLGLTGKPPLTRLAAALLSRRITVVSDKATRELGYRPVVSVKEGLRRLSRDRGEDLG